MSEASPVRPAVAVIGGGYGGINAAKDLDEIADVVLVEPKDARDQACVAAARLSRTVLVSG